jgi:hypothetical protein
MLNPDSEQLINDFHLWLKAESIQLSEIENLDTVIAEYLSTRNSDTVENYVGNIDSIRQHKVHEQLTNELIKMGAKPKNKIESEFNPDILERYKNVPLHAIFFFSTEDKIVSKYILENWGALDSLSGNYCDIHPSVDQFENIEDAYDLIDKLDVLRNSKFTFYSQLPGVFFWNIEGASEYISFGNKISQVIISKIVRTVFEEIRKKPNIHSVSKAKKMIEETRKMPSKVKQNHTSIWSDLLAFLVAFVVIIGSLVFASQWVSPLILGILFIATILVFLLVSALVLRRQGELSETNFMSLVIEVIKRLPLLRQMSGTDKEK